VLAGGTADADARRFQLRAGAGEPCYNIGENTYLYANASTVGYEVDVTLNDDGTWSYQETTMLRMKEFDDLFPHTDHNTLHKVG
jgi:hypothetical protein